MAAKPAKDTLLAQHWQRALAAHETGRLEEALREYAKVLEQQPTHAGALANQASLLARLGRHAEALAVYRQAVAVQAVTPELWFNRGNLQLRLGLAREAIESFENALRLDPSLYPAHGKLAQALAIAGDGEAALRHYREALRHAPNDLRLLRPYGDLLFSRDDPEAALAVYRRVAALQPDQADIHNAIGVALQATGQWAEAEAAWMRCLALDGCHAVAWTNLGTFYRLRKRPEDSLRCLHQAARIRPRDADVVSSLAHTLIERGAVHEALTWIEPVLAEHPQHAELLNMKALALAHQARVDEAQELLAQARQAKPDDLTFIGNSLFSSLYSDRFDLAGLSRLHRQLAEGIARQHPPCPAPYRARSQGDKLRVGYLSPDLRSHPVGFFLEPILEQHLTDDVHITCYALPCAPDALTARLQRLAHRWRHFSGGSAERIAAQIQADGIDILIDLAGYTAGNRMDLLARKPAPIQAAFLGYPFTTGLPAMNYLIADRHVVPPHTEAGYTEQVLRLEHSFLCYRPQPGTPEVAPLPALRNGFVTFGSYNNLPKISPSCLDLWARVLRAAPDARLTLMASSLADATTRERLRQSFAQRGIAPERILPLPPVTPLNRFLAEYGRIDIALDTFPYNGGTTSCDALWMGVPVVTLAGEAFPSRMGLSLLNTVNHPEWGAETPDDYVRIAKELAADLPALAMRRARLREEMRTSGLCDAPAYVASLENLYRRMAGESAQYR